MPVCDPGSAPPGRLARLPRAVDNLAVRSLLSAYADGKSIVDESSSGVAVAEVTAE